MPETERDGAKLQVDGKSHEIPAGGDPIKVPLPPGEHSLKIERPDCEAFWKGNVEAGKEQTILPEWKQTSRPEPPTKVDPLAQQTEAFRKALGEIQAADVQFNGRLKSAEELVAAWNFTGRR